MSLAEYIFIIICLVLVGGSAMLWRRRRAIQQGREEQQERQRLRAEALAQYPKLERAFVALNRTEYLATSEVKAWAEAFPQATSAANWHHLAAYLDPPASALFRTWCQFAADIPAAVRDHNENFLRRRIFEESAAFDKVERYPLTERQRQAIVTNEDTTLTIAGAGTGKTSTIVGKVDYLVRRGFARPFEILILAYGRKAAAELKERLAPFLGNDSAHTSTFHALGLSIISAVEGSRPSLSSMVEDGTALKQFFRARLRLLLASPDGQFLLTSILAEHLDEPEPEISALNGGKTGDEFIRAQQARGLRAINGI